MNDDEKNEKRGTEKDSSAPGKVLIFLLGLIFLPAILLAGLMYLVLLRKLKQKFSITFVVAVILNVFSLLIWGLSGAGEKVIGVLQNLREFPLYWTDLIPAVLSVNITLGSIIGTIIIAWQIRQLNDKNNRHLRELEGSWMYQFKFRRTPYEYYRRNKMIQNLKDGKYQSKDKVPLGIDEEEDNVIYRYNTEMPQSTLISGTVGSGKTVTQFGSIHSDIVNGISTVIIDFKNSTEFSSKIAKWTSDHNRNFYHFVKGAADKYPVPNSPGQAFYDPLKNGGSSRADMLLGMREYDVSADMYKQGMRELLQSLFRIMEHVDKRKTKNIRWNEGEIYKIHSIVNGLNGGALGNLSELIDATDGTEVEAMARDFELRVKTRTHVLNGAFLQLQGQIKTLVHSEYGRWLKNSKDGRNIDLFKLLKDEGNVILFSIDGDREKDFAKYLGSLIMSDLSAVSSKRRHHGIKSHVTIYIDEFQAVSPTSLAPLLEKSRQAGFGVTMASQSFEQIVAAADANGEAHLKSILDTCANFIIHAGSTESSAERLAGIIGKEEKTVYRQGHQKQNFFFSLNWKNRRNQTLNTSTETKWIIPPSFFMNLSIPKKSNGYKSTAVIIKKSSDDPELAKKKIEGTVVRKVWMIPDNRVLQDYFSPTEEYKDDSDDDLIYEDDKVQENSFAELEEPHFDEPEAPLNYLNHHSEISEEKDELDAFTSEEIDQENDEDEDGGFGFEVIADESEEDSVLDSIDPKLFSQKRETTTPRPPIVDSVPELAKNKESLPTKKKNLPTRNPAVHSGRGLPQKPSMGARNSVDESFNMFSQQDNFTPAKRSKERPKIAEPDIDLDSDVLPDLE